MTRHTPGPWRVFESPGITAVMTTGDQKEVIHWTGFDASDYGDAVRANARLIAQAPALLEACQAFVDLDRTSSPEALSEQWRNAARLARKAIRLALPPELEEK